jgi:hypothetical protein
MGYRKRTDNKTDKITDEMPESIPENVPEPTPEIPMPEPEIDNETIHRAEDARKQEIADKRRASLALARSKIIPKSTLKKQAEEAVKVKDDVIKIKQEETDAMRLKYERDRVKQLEDNLNALQKLIADKPNTSPAPVPTPVPVPILEPPKRKRPSRSKEALALALAQRATEAPTEQPKHVAPKKSVEPRMIAPISTQKLIEQSYGEQLQERLRSQAINKIMNDTFGGF